MASESGAQPYRNGWLNAIGISGRMRSEYAASILRRWIHAGDGSRKVRVVLVSEPQAHRFDAEAEFAGLAVEGLVGLGGREEAELLRSQNQFINRIGAGSLPNQLARGTHRSRDDNLDGLRKQRPVHYYVRLELFGAYYSLPLLPSPDLSSFVCRLIHWSISWREKRHVPPTLKAGIFFAAAKR